MMAGSKPRDSLDTNVQGFQLLSGYALSYAPTLVLNQKPQTAVLWRVKVQTLTPPFPSRTSVHLPRL